MEAERPATISRERQIGVVLLSVFAIFTVGLGALQIRNTMYAPFALTNDVPATVRHSVQSTDALRFRDTDRDTLSDFEELYVYGTSPYLYDTFSYGFSDAEVVAQGLPLCPRGQDCSNLVVSGGAVPRASATATAENILPGGAAALAAPSLDLAALLADPKALRQLLRETGTSEEVLNQVDDATLIALVRELMSTSSPFANLPALIAPATRR